MGAREGGVEIDGLLKELLCEVVVICGEFGQMPEAALIGGPSVEAAWRLA